MSDVHSYSTRSSTQNKLSQILVNTDMHGKKLFKFFGPRVFNNITNLDFYKKCKCKNKFKRKMKDFHLNE